MDNYIVSARKYRPMSFNSVVGQHALTTTLKNAIASGKLAHAYLFCGPRGVGKTTCARIFAKTINCLTPTADGEACNACESCVAFNEQRSYNIHELDAASNNSVDDIRQLIEQAQVPPQVGRYKVFIIDEVHMLSQQAFNAFLKTLEEPPAHAIFILATTEKHKILPTILSRCQIYDFSRMTVADTVKHLEYVAGKEGISYEQEALHVIAEKADGGMRDALSIFDQVASYCEGNITYQKVIADLNVLDYDEYFAMTDLLLQTKIPETMVRFDHILNQGFEANYFIGGLASHFRNLLMSRDEATLPLLEVSDAVRKRYAEQAKACQPKFLYRALKLCNDCDINYRTSRNKRLLVELTLIEVAQAASGEDDTGCGRRPIRRLSPLFQTAAAKPAAAAAHSKLAQQSTKPLQAPSAAHNTQTHVQASASPVPAASPSALRSTAKTLSIRAIKQSYASQQTGNDTSKQGAGQQPNTPAQTSRQSSTGLQTPFDANMLEQEWFRFAHQLPREQIAMVPRLQTMKPQIHDGWNIVVPVENSFVADSMRQLLPQLTSFLRFNLRNDSITITIKLAEGEELHRNLSRMEIFNDMLERCSGLRILNETIGLELD